MNPYLRLFRFCILLLFLSVSALAQDATCPPSGVLYEVSLKDREAHILHVEMHYRSTDKGREFQLPVWNALYQIRDFAQFVSNVRYVDEIGEVEPALKLDKTTWRVEGDGGCSVVSYEIYANQQGPFGAQLNEEHAFLNWAQVLMYPVDGRNLSFSIRLKDVPAGWRVRDGGIFKFADHGDGVTATAPNYDTLVDAPIEIGEFAQKDFTDGGATYHLVFHAAPGEYKPEELIETVQKIVHAETEWMQDRPFTEYTFLYHFPEGQAGGGMEHAYSTAIDVSATRLAENPLSFASVTAHEFFHLWNVKRIRPQSLEPIDYTRENYTRSLWFSEGVTSTVSDWMLVRSGLIDGKQFLERLARQIAELERRPAHRVQSVEESSLDAWLEKYPYYNSPNRSVNYYNKGQLVGVMLDLEMREHSQGRKCLRDLFQYLNENYAKRGAYFPDSMGIEMAAEAVAGGDFEPFFERYVSGTADLPYDEFLKTVGLQVIRRASKVPDSGFGIARSVGRSAPTVSRVDPAGPAELAGLAVGDVIDELNGKPASDLATVISNLVPGETITMKVHGPKGKRDISLKLGSRYSEELFLGDLATVTPEMSARRAAWIRGEAEAPKEAAP